MSAQDGIYQIGRSYPRRDALTKVSGTEKYAADYYGEEMLWAGVKRAGIPHGRIRGMNTAAAQALAGVEAVLTHQDVQGSNRQGVVRKDQPVLADEKVRHCGDAVALVIARDRETLGRAVDLIALDLEPLPAVFDPEEALAPGAPLVHEDNPRGNVLIEGTLQTGNAKAAFSECEAVAEVRFETPRQEHAYLETEAGWAIFKEGGIEIVASTQTPFRDRMEVSEALGLSPEKVRIVAPYCGGAFGGKDGITVQTLLGLAALRCPGRPVKMWWDRKESFLSSVKRHPAALTYRLGAKGDGSFHALEATIHYDTGPYDHLGGVVAALGLEHAGGPYRIPHTLVQAFAVYTNNPIGGAFRGFGVPQVTAAMEQAVDVLAEKLSLSPLEIRLRNGVKKGDRNPAGVTLTGSTGLLECLKAIEAHPLWTERSAWKACAGQFKKRGLGMACLMHGMGYGPIVPDVGNAKIELTKDGRFCVYSGVVDMGQGNAGTYLQIAGHVLNQDETGMEMVSPDTTKCLPSGSSSASRTTYTFGNALIGAAEALKARILQRVSDLFMAGGMETTALLRGRVRHLPTGREIALRDLARLLDDSERVSTFRFQAPVSTEIPTRDETLRLHGLPHLLFSYGAHLARVEVDTLTGEVEVKRYLAVTDCGRIINPQILEQQIQGGIAQGLGYALLEDFVVEGGMIRTTDFSTYIIPTALDIPDMESMTVELLEETGPFGLKGAGEIPMDGPLPAVANAIADACGIRPLRSPLTAERILAALEEKGRKGEES
jgi:CO/xanthine dehydrogenase Mo-binding subunit